MADDRQLLIKFILQDQTKRGFDSVNKQVAGTKRSLFSLKNAVLGIAGSLVVRQTLELANTYQNLQNRLKLVTDSTSELASVQQDLFEISQRTRGGFAETVELYQKLALQSQSLGLQSSELSQITENVNKVIAIAGVNSVQASAGILQLSQAFASGRLQGDEFRSISENIPPLLDIFAKELGVTRGELKKLGSEGKITSEIIASALLKETENINEAFGQLSPTIGQASTTVGNSFLNLVGKFTEVTGASDLLAESLITVSNELDEISKTIELFAGVKLKDVDKAFQENADSIKTLITTTNELDNILGQIGLVRESEIFGVKTLSNEYSELEKALLKYREELEKVITTEDESDTTGKTGTDLSEEIKKLEKLIKANESGLRQILKQMRNMERMNMHY
jgi:tape measure domain-containing protein